MTVILIAFGGAQLKPVVSDRLPSMIEMQIFFWNICIKTHSIF